MQARYTDSHFVYGKKQFHTPQKGTLLYLHPEYSDQQSDFSVTLSRENVEALSDIDLMVVYGDEALLEALQKDELMSEIPAIKNGAVVLLDSTSRLAASTTPSILSIPATIDEYLDVLSEACGKINE